MENLTAVLATMFSALVKIFPTIHVTTESVRAQQRETSSWSTTAALMVSKYPTNEEVGGA